MKKGVMFFCLCFLSKIVSATGVHTWHDVKAKQGEWRGRLVITSSQQKGYFTDSESNNKGQVYDFSLSSLSPFVFGFGFNYDGTDFDVAYSLTLYQTNFVSKACIFNVTASAPATPDVRVASYNGASCDYHVVHRRGQNFDVG